jgi:hypothetical protein
MSRSYISSPPLASIGVLWDSFLLLPWMEDQTDARSLPPQDRTTQKYEYKQPYLERDLNPRSQCPSDQVIRLPQHGHWDLLKVVSLHGTVQVKVVSEPRHSHKTIHATSRKPYKTGFH